MSRTPLVHFVYMWLQALELICCFASLQRTGSVSYDADSEYTFIAAILDYHATLIPADYLLAHNSIDIFEVVNQLQWPVDRQQWIEWTLRRPQKHHSWQFRDTTLWGEREGLRPTATPFGDQFRIPRPYNYPTVIRVLHYHCALRHQQVTTESNRRLPALVAELLKVPLRVW